MKKWRLRRIQKLSPDPQLCSEEARHRLRYDSILASHGASKFKWTKKVRGILSSRVKAIHGCAIFVHRHFLNVCSDVG